MLNSQSKFDVLLWNREIYPFMCYIHCISMALAWQCFVYPICPRPVCQSEPRQYVFFWIIQVRMPMSLCGFPQAPCGSQFCDSSGPPDQDPMTIEGFHMAEELWVKRHSGDTQISNLTHNLSQHVWGWGGWLNRAVCVTYGGMVTVKLIPTESWHGGTGVLLDGAQEV